VGGVGWFRGGMGCVYSLLTWEVLVRPIVAIDWEEQASETAVR
jgi:hypothetical protein